MSTQLIKTAFEQALQASGRDPSEEMLPVSALPEALELLGQDPEDDFVLGVFAECAVNGTGRRKGSVKLVSLEKFEEVCKVLLASSNDTQHSLDIHNRDFHNSDTGSPVMHDAGGGFEVAHDQLSEENQFSDEEEDAEYRGTDSDGSTESQSSTRDSLKVPRKSSKSMQEAAALLPRLLQRANKPQGARLTAADLIVIAASVGEQLKANEAEQMVEESIRMCDSRSKDQRKSGEHSVGLEELATVIQRPG